MTLGRSSRRQCRPRRATAPGGAGWSRALLSMLVMLCLGLLAACPFGTTATLVAGSNARLIVTGTSPGDTVFVDVGGQQLVSEVTAADPVVIYLELEPGTYEGLLELQRGAERRCTVFNLLLPTADDTDIAGVDLTNAPLCEALPDGGVDGGVDAGPDDDGGVPLDAGPDTDAGPDDDGGVLIDVSFSLLVEIEQVVIPCLLEPCDRVTSVDAEADLTVVSLDLLPLSAVVPAGDFDLLTTDTLSDEADELFAGADAACPQPRPGDPQTVVLERTLESDEGPIVETVDVTGCTEGVAPVLRARLSFLRALLLELTP